MSTKEIKALTKVITQQSADIAELKSQVAELVKLLTKEPVSRTKVGKTKKPVGTTGTVIVKNYKKSLLVTGETKPVKDTLKGLGGKWNGALVGWIFAVSREDDIMEALADIVGNLVREGSDKVPKVEDPKEDSEEEDSGSESESDDSGSESEDEDSGSESEDESGSDSESD